MNSKNTSSTKVRKKYCVAVLAIAVISGTAVLACYDTTTRNCIKAHQSPSYQCGYNGDTCMDYCAPHTSITGDWYYAIIEGYGNELGDSWTSSHLLYECRQPHFYNSSLLRCYTGSTIHKEQGKNYYCEQQTIDYSDDCWVW